MRRILLLMLCVCVVTLCPIQADDDTLVFPREPLQGDQPSSHQTTSRPHGSGHRRTTTRRGSTTSTTTTVAPANTPAFTANETQCFVQNKVLYAENGQCYRLREKGPCANDSMWLVLDVDEAVRAGGALRPVCKMCPCCDKNLRVYWPLDGQCHKMSEKETLCPFPGTDLGSDPFGDGECACKKTPPHIRYEQDVINMTNYYGGCYPLYRQGPCDSLKVLTPVVLKGSGYVGRCTVDPCHADNRRHPNVTYATYAKDGRCYQLGSRGPCESEEESYGVHRITKQPQCILPVNNIFKLPERCQTDMSGDCQKEINLSEDDKTIFALELLMSAEKRKKRRSRNSV